MVSPHIWRTRIMLQVNYRRKERSTLLLNVSDIPSGKAMTRALRLRCFPEGKNRYYDILLLELVERFAGHPKCFVTICWYWMEANLVEYLQDARKGTSRAKIRTAVLQLEV